MIEEIATDVLNKLNATQSKDFDDMVGLKANLTKIESLLDLGYDKVKMIGISGPAGIGKSTIARALHHSQLSSRFQHSCYMDNLRESNAISLHEYRAKLSLQEQLLSQVLNLKDIRIRHLGAIQERLHDQRVLIILDDVTSLEQLKVLANIEWFGPGSRIIVITKNKDILLHHGINDIYHVGFPSEADALKIFCLSAFRQTSPPDGYMTLLECKTVLRLCGNLPLNLYVLGSTFRGRSDDGCRLGVLISILYEGLSGKSRTLFFYLLQCSILEGRETGDLIKILTEIGKGVGQMGDLIKLLADFGEEIGDRLEEIFDTVKDFGEEIGDGLKETFDTVKDFGEEIGDGLEEIFDTVKDFGEEIGDGLKETFDTVKDFGEEIGDGLKETFDTVCEAWRRNW
ncbi:NB-ARC [Arabidopsis thaliana x Arabidopsis arenosa]|uniref:NB-ARC n=1 Tax=Arabidopsis thaliana x Arabidopsis arenosa TaxID=1240361 RepID=A0A8T2BIX6_9BRAS|nr:NB-ARC [Arabidopsis thaliana x Arabidopsis arenosa]